MGWLDGQVALVTGGGSGIGHGIVTRFVEEGARVGVLERVGARVEQLQTTFGNAVCAVQGEVTRLEDNQRAVAATVRTFGQLDVFVGNAGVFDSYLRFDEIPEDTLSAAFDEQFNVNVKGCLLGARAALPELIKTAGCMIFTASVAGFNSGGGGVLYTAYASSEGFYPLSQRERAGVRAVSERGAGPTTSGDPHPNPLPKGEGTETALAMIHSMSFT